MLKKMRFRKQKVIQADDIKRLDHSTDRKETHKDLKKGETVFLPVYTADDEQADLSREQQDQDAPSKDAFRRHRKVFDPRPKLLLYIFRKVLNQRFRRQRYRDTQDAKKEKNTPCDR